MHLIGAAHRSSSCGEHCSAGVAEAFARAQHRLLAYDARAFDLLDLAEAVGDDLPSTGGRKVDIWSLCFQGGTFDRVKERCMV